MFGHRFYGARFYGPRYFGDGGAGAPPAVVARGYQDPGFWTEQHRAIKEREEAPRGKKLEELPALEAFTAPIVLPKKIVISDDDEIEEIIEMLKVIEFSDDF